MSLKNLITKKITPVCVGLAVLASTGCSEKREVNTEQVNLKGKVMFTTATSVPSWDMGSDIKVYIKDKNGVLHKKYYYPTNRIEAIKLEEIIDKKYIEITTTSTDSSRITRFRILSDSTEVYK